MKRQNGEGERFVTRYRVVLERRPASRSAARPPRLDRLQLVAEWLTAFVAPYDRKILGALYLDAGSHLLGHHVAHVGTRAALDAEPRSVFIPAILARACGMVVFQNHLLPSHPAPSAADILRQYRLRKAGDLLGIPVLDYVILGADGRYASISLPRGGARCRA